MRRSSQLGVVVALVALVALVAGPACGRSAASAAAERAQDACIGALGPVAKGRRPTPAVVGEALADAEAAARVDRRWRPLRGRVHAVREAGDGPASTSAIDALVAECERVNGIVRREQRRDGGAGGVSGGA